MHTILESEQTIFRIFIILGLYVVFGVQGVSGQGSFQKEEGNILINISPQHEEVSLINKSTFCPTRCDRQCRKEKVILCKEKRSVCKNDRKNCIKLAKADKKDCIKNCKNNFKGKKRRQCIRACRSAFRTQKARCKLLNPCSKIACRKKDFCEVCARECKSRCPC